ncbi:MAG: D-inositol-3-phosphate glycosyltransferase [Anaerolineae bacterium]|nr:D-inositol-3-phosphate glycosyltransferase [Anaerolineae bacterium]
MKSLLVSHDFLPGLSGGIAVFYTNLARHAAGDIEVLAPQLGNWQPFDDQQPFVVHRRKFPIVPPGLMRTIRLRGWHLLTIGYVAVSQLWLYTWHTRQLVKQRNVELILIGHLYLALVGWLVQQLTGRPYAIILHGSELHRYWHVAPIRRVLLFLLNHARLLVVNSQFTKQQYLDRGVSPTQTIICLHPGVDTNLFKALNNPPAVSLLSQLHRQRIILTVARLVEWKGQDIVIRALPQVLQTVPEAVYLVVGNGPHRPQLEQLVAELKLEDHVVFAGFVPDADLIAYYAAAEVMIMTSREIHPGLPIEGFGIAYLEANLAGLPVIGSRMGGAQEAIVDGVTGLLVDPHNEQEVAAAIIRLLQQPELAKIMGRAGQQRAKTEFTWERQAALFHQHLAKLNLNGRNA